MKVYYKQCEDKGKFFIIIAPLMYNKKPIHFWKV